ncbi:hypothetical protein E1301_Tti020577 [Triplophysa tibetana]|uniref:Uncharacterized protein n=1 Tax=Triplophysa tibetana TaxID=1572043 RepID=A0A5A9P017_9TELE|nr:hypothetical protein E1301_Tti020577 [Triplophysa tibetana]
MTVGDMTLSIRLRSSTARSVHRLADVTNLFTGIALRIKTPSKHLWLPGISHPELHQQMDTSRERRRFLLPDLLKHTTGHFEAHGGAFVFGIEPGHMGHLSWAFMRFVRQMDCSTPPD